MPWWRILSDLPELVSSSDGDEDDEIPILLKANF